MLSLLISISIKIWKWIAKVGFSICFHLCISYKKNFSAFSSATLEILIFSRTENCFKLRWCVSTLFPFCSNSVFPSHVSNILLMPNICLFYFVISYIWLNSWVCVFFTHIFYCTWPKKWYTYTCYII